MDEKVDIISVAFNKPEIVRAQTTLIKKNLKDNYELFIVDNSNDNDRAAEIRGICGAARVKYIRSESTRSTGSMSHGLCLNWAYETIVKPSSSRYFGTIDHDIFPIRPTSIIPHLGNGLYGVLQVVLHWYLWPGFSFFDKQFIERVAPGAKLNFCPVPKMDTGGGNWAELYSKIDMRIIPRIGHDIKSLRPGDCPQLANYVMVGSDWLHMLNGSEWIPDTPGTEPKVDLMMKLLDSVCEE